MAPGPKFFECTAMVEVTLRDRMGRAKGVSATTELRDLLRAPAARKSFQREIQLQMKAQGFRIKLSDIPIGPRSTIRDIARALFTKALPGDPGIPDPL